MPQFLFIVSFLIQVRHLFECVYSRIAFINTFCSQVRRLFKDGIYKYFYSETCVDFIQGWRLYFRSQVRRLFEGGFYKYFCSQVRRLFEGGVLVE